MHQPKRKLNVTLRTHTAHRRLLLSPARPGARGSSARWLARDEDVARDRLVDPVPERAVRAGVEHLKARGGERGGGVLAAEIGRAHV